MIGFLRSCGLEKDFTLNIEVNHATLAGHAPSAESISNSKTPVMKPIVEYSSHVTV